MTDALNGSNIKGRSSERPFRGPIDGPTFSWVHGAPCRRARGRR